MAKNYQRKQTVAIFVICLILVTGMAVYVYGWPSTKNSINYKNPSLEPIVSNKNIDTDWQKQFIDNKLDSTFKSKAGTSEPDTPKESLNPTEILGRNFFSKYVELRQAGLNTDSESINTVTTQLISESLAGITEPKVYTSSEIKIIATGTNLDTTKLYAENLMKILKSWMPVQNETEIAITAFEQNDMTLLKNIDPVISGYKNALSKLLLLPVIQPLAQNHLDLINGISLQIFNAQALRNADKDPLTGLAAVSMEIKSLEAIANAISKMQNYFATNGIVFNLPVSGSILQSK